jgi:exodeoxyribonuclease VII small subunit
MSTKQAIDLEKALNDLEELVEELESGDLPLEKAMQKFEEGIKLTRNCQLALKDAEQKVEVLLKSAGGEETLEDFDVEAEEARSRAEARYLIYPASINSISATTVDSTPARTEGSGEILNNGEW